MNTKELIEKYEDKLKDVQLKFGASFKTKVYEGVVESLKQLDEPQKPVVPQFVADWYEEHKEDYDYELWDYFTSFDGQEDDDFKEWIRKEGTQPIITLVNMHQFGYEVEKGKRYRVRVKGVNGYGEYLNENLDSKNWFFASKKETEGYRTKHTRKELEEADFGWVFDCEGIKIEEVE